MLRSYSSRFSVNPNLVEHDLIFAGSIEVFTIQPYGTGPVQAALNKDMAEYIAAVSPESFCINRVKVYVDMTDWLADNKKEIIDRAKKKLTDLELKALGLTR